MAYFHCLIGGGSSGGGYELTVTCDADFAGTTITATDGVTTLTATCPSASPYEVEFDIPNGGEWTISGIIGGSTFSASIDIPDALELHSTPEGSTVIPTDNIQTWLACAGITDKAYTTLNEVLADSTTLLALMSDDNAVDYLVRSTTWASGLTADSTAMTDIGANDYCAETLLADSTWVVAIANSQYVDSVLDIKVPTMTSNTTPRGTVIGTTDYSTPSFPKWYAFDKNTTTKWVANTATNSYLGYDFTSSVKIDVVSVLNETSISQQGVKNCKLQCSDDNTTWSDASEQVTIPQGGSLVFYSNTATPHRYWRIHGLNNYGSSYISIVEIQFYGRSTT